LVFPAEAAVYPVEHRPVSASGMEDTRRQLVWEDTQHLAAGYFTSRTMAQFVVVEPRATTAGIRILESPDGSSPQVANELGMEIERLAFRDSRGNLFHIVGLGAGERGTATSLHRSYVVESPPLPTDEKAAHEETDQDRVGSVWSLRYRETRPTFPPGFDPRSLDDVTEFFAVRRWRPQSSMADPHFEGSVMEIGIRSAIDDGFKSLEPRSFVAILPRSPFVSLGVESVDMESGFHVVVGRW
jgi:hypothetical protein